MKAKHRLGLSIFCEVTLCAAIGFSLCPDKKGILKQAEILKNNTEQKIETCSTIKDIQASNTFKDIKYAFKQDVRAVDTFIKICSMQQITDALEKANTHAEEQSMAKSKL